MKRATQIFWDDRYGAWAFHDPGRGSTAPWDPVWLPTRVGKTAHANTIKAAAVKAAREQLPTGWARWVRAQNFSVVRAPAGGRRGIKEWWSGEEGTAVREHARVAGKATAEAARSAGKAVAKTSKAAAKGSRKKAVQQACSLCETGKRKGWAARRRQAPVLGVPKRFRHGVQAQGYWYTIGFEDGYATGSLSAARLDTEGPPTSTDRTWEAAVRNAWEAGVRRGAEAKRKGMDIGPIREVLREDRRGNPISAGLRAWRLR